jgi:YD repeat-containing protein
VDACPFDVLEIDRFFAVVARPEVCCGAVVCAEACPNGSLRIDEGELTPERPRVGPSLESLDAPGLYLAGDLTGLPLIRNAMRQGASVAERIAETAARDHPELDLVVIGAGPAGLSAALRAQELDLRVACLEQGAFAESLRSFPRGKVVFDLPGATPLEGPLWMQEATKEELIARWTHAVRAAALDVREERRVTGVERDAAGFVVSAARPDGSITHVRGARVLLAIGRRGTPRTVPIRIAPDCEGRVSYALADAAAFAGRHVVVVGLGDTAIEAALALAQQPGTTVTVVHRGETFTRGKARNVAALRARVAKRALHLRFCTTIEALDPQVATLRTPEGSETIPCDAVLVLIGGEPSWNLVHRAGVRLASEVGVHAPDG